MRLFLQKLVTILGATLFVVVASVLLSSSSFALSLNDVVSGRFRGEGQPIELFNGTDALIPRAINLMLFIVGVLSVIMLIFGGLRYVVSGGDSGRVKDAKNTVLYAIVGLIVAIMGYAIVNWVIGVVGAGAGGGANFSV